MGSPNHHLHWGCAGSSSVSAGAGRPPVVGGRAWELLCVEKGFCEKLHFTFLRWKDLEFSWLSMDIPSLQHEGIKPPTAWLWGGWKVRNWIYGCACTSSVTYAFTVGKNYTTVCSYGFLILPVRAPFFPFWLLQNSHFGCSFPLLLQFSIVCFLPQAWFVSSKL